MLCAGADILRRMEREELPLAGRLLKHIQVKAGSTAEAGGSELDDADGFHSPRCGTYSLAGFGHHCLVSSIVPLLAVCLSSEV